MVWLYFDWSKVHVTLLVSSCSYFEQGEFFFSVAISNKHKKKDMLNQSSQLSLSYWQG